jgi:hypothetical protein
MNMGNLLNNVVKFFRSPKFLKVLFLLGYFAILYANTLHEEYPDEYDNILGGKFIVNGILPYTGFFSHHGPVAYFLSALIYLFSGNSFVKFRIIYSIFLFLYSLGIYQYLKKSIGKLETNFYFFFIVVVGIASTYFWGHMLVADNLSAYFIVPALALIILKVVYKKIMTRMDLIFVSILLSLSLLSALTVMYLVALTYLFCFYFYLKGTDFKITLKNIISFSLIMLAPYLVFGAYLVITQSFGEYLYQSIVFNQKYYIYNYPVPPSGIINPFRYAVIIFHNFYFSFYGLLISIKDLNFAFPFTRAMGIADVALIGYFLLRRNFALSIFFLLSLVFANSRSSPLDSSEKDYQAAVYIMISLFSMCFFISKAWSDLKNNEEHRARLILSFFLLLVGTYSVFNIIFLFSRFQEKVYQKYMGNAALIYDRPDIAPIMNKIVGPNDYMWIGPLEFKEYLYANGKLPSKYQFLIPGMGRSEKIKTEIINDFTKHKPTILYFDKRFNILGSTPETYAKFFTAFLSENYITLYEYKDGNIQYRSLIPISDRIDLETKLYINKDKKQEVIAKMLSENLIKKVPVK